MSSEFAKSRLITVAYGDGIGPELMENCLRILKEVDAGLEFNIIEVGKNIYEKGFNSGIMPSAWDDLKASKILLKAPITTPQGGGFKSLNVTMRKKLGLYANIRPVNSFYPFVATKHPNIDVVIIRENEEDLYTGIEHRQTSQMHQTLKLITVDGCEKIIRYAFEYAIKNNRKKVSCFSKDNIMKLTDGMFHKVFDDIAKNYPQIKTDHHIIDIGCARLAARPEIFDVIVTLNLYGDIISDIAAEISGSVGLAGSANIGKEFAMFEAIHGSAPDIAGKNIANPTGLINAAIMMLLHIGQYQAATKLRNALYKTIEDGIHTQDIFNEKTSKKKVGTIEFSDELISRINQRPKNLKAEDFVEADNNCSHINGHESGYVSKLKNAEKKLIGFDLFIDWQSKFDDLISKINQMESDDLEIKMISSKGLVLWPQIDKHEQIDFDKGQIMLRFVGKGICGKSSNQIINFDKTISHKNIIDILNIFEANKIDFIKYEGLYLFDKECGFSAIQGE